MKSILFPESVNQKSVEKIFDSILDTLYTTKSNVWSRIHEKRSFAVFREMCRYVPAYKKFLTENKVNDTDITSIHDFDMLPPVSKNNYLRKHPWKSLCKDGTFSSKSMVMTSTSGSTGEPFYFPRTASLDVQTSLYYQMFLRSANISKKKSTLVIDSFGMGVWIGGLITYQAFKYISERGYVLSIITPGINKQEIFKALRNIGSTFDQIILCGYPPFVKDVIDQAEDNGVSLKNFNVKIIFAAEGFSETFRDYIVNRVGITEPYRSTMSIYGSADLGTMAYETPLCILLRRLALSNQKLYMRLFNQASRLPTLAQYHPEFVNFESKKNILYCTGGTVLPLVRYDIGDNGGVLTYDELVRLCDNEGVDLQQEIKKAKIQDTVSQLPFVYVYERSDFSASFYGALIYPEYIKKALAHESLYPYITGKFTMYTKNDIQENQYLEINIEIKQNKKVSTSVRAMILKSIQNGLVEQSSEYKKITESLGKRALPKLVFWVYGDETHFSTAGKQKWVKKL